MTYFASMLVEICGGCNNYIGFLLCVKEKICGTYAILIAADIRKTKIHTILVRIFVIFAGGLIGAYRVRLRPIRLRLHRHVRQRVG
jgi:hypothetical protein